MLARIEKILADERNIVIASPALEVSSFVVEELWAFKFARQRSKLAGEIRGSYFVIKGEY